MSTALSVGPHIRPPALLDAILGEITPDSFRRDYLAKRFVHIPGPPGRFRHILSWAAVNQILETQMLSPATIRMKKAGLDVPIDSYLTKYNRAGKVDVLTKISSKAVTRIMRDGGTLILTEIQRSWPPIRDLCQELELQLGAVINVNMYACMGDAHGFGIHYDLHDVLVIQVEGRKHWQVCDRRAVVPYPDEQFNTDERPGVTRPIWDAILTDGDALYLPRGQWHFARGIREPTIHLSVGIVSPTDRDFLQWLLKDLSETPTFRLNLPLFGGADEFEVYKSTLAAIVSDAMRRPGLRDDFERSHAASTAIRPRFGLPWSATEGALPPNMSGLIRLTSAHALRTEPSPESADSVYLLIAGRDGPSFRPSVAALCDFLSQRAPIPVHTFLSEWQGRFDSSLLLDFLRELVSQHLIVITVSESAV